MPWRCVLLLGTPEGGGVEEAVEDIRHEPTQEGLSWECGARWVRPELWG